MMIKIFSGKERDSLTKLRHAKWEESIMVASEIDRAKLPPSERAVYFHSFRVHLEMKRALVLDIDCGINPCDWGWKRIEQVLRTIMTDKPAAPESLLKGI